MTGNMTVVTALRAVAQVGDAFSELASWLRQLPGSMVVTRPCWMSLEHRIHEDHYRIGQGEGFRFEWYAEAQAENGRSLTFVEELSCHDGEWMIEASAKMTDDGETILLELPTRHAVDADDLVAELVGQTRLLLSRREEAWREFLKYR